MDPQECFGGAGSLFAGGCFLPSLSEDSSLSPGEATTKVCQGVSNMSSNAGVATGTLNKGANNTSSYNQCSAPPAAPMAGNSADAFRKRVQAIFEEPSSTKLAYGLHRNDVMQRMVGVTRERVNDAIDFIFSEGHVYSTIDDDRFKSLIWRQVSLYGLDLVLSRKVP
ncbi:unnamed protein product [Calypogeia fissa]